MFTTRKRRRVPAILNVDRLGRRRSPLMNGGTAPANKGKRYPAEIYTAQEIGRLIRCCGRRGLAAERNRAMIVLMWRCGLRVDEVVSLHPRDVDLDAGTVTVRHGKGDKRRVVGIDPQAAAVLVRWLDLRSRVLGRRQAPLFCTISNDRLGPGRPMHTNEVRGFLARAARRAGIEKRVHPHGLRHTFAVELYREGVGVVHIQRLLGHTDLATTARYLDHLMPLEAVELAAGRAWPTGLAA